MQQDRNKHRETEDTENTDLVVLIVTNGGGWRVSASSCHLLTRVARMGRGVARTNNASLWLFEGERFAPRFLITVSQCFNIAVGFPIQKKQRNTETRRHGEYGEYGEYGSGVLPFFKKAKLLAILTCFYRLAKISAN
jgi:hypothetical protein